VSDSKAFWAKLRENPAELKFFLFQLVGRLGPLDTEGRTHGEETAEYAEWLLDPNTAPLIGKAASGVALTDPEEARKPMFRPHEKTWFAGAGARSMQQARQLHDRLDFALTCISANQQEGMMGTTYDHESVAALDQHVRLVIEDLAYALLGPEKAATFINFDAEPLGDVDYQRAMAPCIEAEQGDK
jgi:hypothetical protein